MYLTLTLNLTDFYSNLRMSCSQSASIRVALRCAIKATLALAIKLRLMPSARFKCNVLLLTTQKVNYAVEISTLACVITLNFLISLSRILWKKMHLSRTTKLLYIPSKRAILLLFITFFANSKMWLEPNTRWQSEKLYWQVDEK